METTMSVVQSFVVLIKVMNDTPPSQPINGTVSDRVCRAPGDCHASVSKDPTLIRCLKTGDKHLFWT